MKRFKPKDPDGTRMHPVTCCCASCEACSDRADDPDAEKVRRNLLAEIEHAFGDVGLEDGLSLHQARASDDWADNATIAQVRRYDTETRWQDIPPEKIEYFHDTLSFMDPKGFRFHIPAFMTYALRNYKTSSSPAIGSSLFCLDIREDPDWREHCLDKISLLSVPQRRVVYRYFRFFAEQGDTFERESACESINRYWKQYAENPP